MSSDDSFRWLITIWKRGAIIYLSFHFGSALLFLFAFPHVLVLLLSLGERLQELVEDAKELIWLHLAGILAEVLYCPQELWEPKRRGHTGIKFTAGHSRTMFYSVFDCFTGDSLDPSSLK